MYRILFATFSILSLLLLIPTAHSAELKPANREVSDVQWDFQWTGMAKATTPQGLTVYKYKFNYDSKTENPVFVKGIGSVPPKGDLAFWSFDSSVKFSKTPDGPATKTIFLPKEITATKVATMKYARPPLDFPVENLFDLAGQTYPWPTPHTFVARVMNVLSRKNLQYLAYQRDGLSFIMSTYTSLENVPSHLRVQLALLLSHPYTTDNKAYYKVRYTLRERRVKEDSWADNISEEANKAALEFVQKFIAELAENAGEKK